MAYLGNTILTRTEKQGDPLDVVRVIGPSPVRSSPHEEWNGTDELYLIQPHEEFGITEVVPETVLSRDYEVTEYPEDPGQKIVLDSPAHRAERRLSPEQKFARDAKKAKRPARTAEK